VSSDGHSDYGDRCFAAAGPRLWNSLPAHLRQMDINFEQFKRLLKTFSFGCWEHGTLWLTVKLHPLSHLTYLLTIVVVAGIPCQDPLKRKTLADSSWNNIRSRPGAPRPQVCFIITCLLLIYCSYTVSCFSDLYQEPSASARFQNSLSPNSVTLTFTETSLRGKS